MFFIYGKPNCKYCEAAKLLLNMKSKDFMYIDLEKHPEWRDPEWKKVPQIFYWGNYIGGYMALEAYLDAEVD